MQRSRFLGTGFAVPDRVVTNDELSQLMDTTDEWIKAGQYRRVLVVGSEIQSTGLEVSSAGRHVALIFADGAGAVVLGAAEKDDGGILGFDLHSEGAHA